MSNNKNLDNNNNKMTIINSLKQGWNNHPNLQKLIIALGGFILGIILTSQLFYLNHLGLPGLSSFEHPDFNKIFLDNYYSDADYYYNTTEYRVKLTISVKNTWVQSEVVKTWLQTPNFIDTECNVLNPIDSSETCDNYIIPSGSIKKLAFNIHVKENSKNKQQFCLYTEGLTKGLFGANKKDDCMPVTINDKP